MSGPSPTAPPPPAAAYQPAYQPAPSAAPAAGAKLPVWLDLGIIVTGVGALLILFGFIFGDLAIGQIGTSASNPGNASNYQGDLEFFFILTGLGIFLTIGGWMFRVMNPLWKARPKPVPTYTAPPVAAPAPMAAPPAPMAAPAAPNCAVCGKPTTYIAQYGRYYCYTDAKYV